MIDEEIKQLIINLRWLGKLDYEPEIAQPCLRAADEIERLAEEVKRLGTQRDEAVDVCTRMGERLAEARGYNEVNHD